MKPGTLDNHQKAVYACLCYFDIFHHPLRLHEVREFSSHPFSESLVHDILDELIALNLVRSEKGFYLLKHSSGQNISKRLEAEKRFHKKQQTIKRYAALIARFPFVESVAISGSCSKGLLEEDGDVDYFIITKPGRLWLCRSILVAFKKFVLFNSKKYFCVNYFVSAAQLRIPDQNLFVACEISTLMPVHNQNLFEQFLRENSWVARYFPNRKGYDGHFLQNLRPGLLSKPIEVLLNGKAGEFLDRKLFEMTLNIWQKKFNDFSREDFDLNLRSKSDVSKHHPRGFQKKVLSEFEQRLSAAQFSFAE